MIRFVIIIDYKYSHNVIVEHIIKTAQNARTHVMGTFQMRSFNVSFWSNNSERTTFKLLSANVFKWINDRWSVLISMVNRFQIAYLFQHVYLALEHMACHMALVNKAIYHLICLFFHDLRKLLGILQKQPEQLVFLNVLQVFDIFYSFFVFLSTYSRTSEKCVLSSFSSALAMSTAPTVASRS